MADDLGVTADQVLEGMPGFSLVSITVQDATDQGQTVEPDPTTPPVRPEDPTHAHVLGDKPKSVQRSFAKNCKPVTN